MKDAIIFEMVGECEIIRDLVIKKWNLLCRISRYKDSYILIQYTPKGKRKLKVAIKKEDAMWLIKELHLQYVKSEVFNEAGTYLSV